MKKVAEILNINQVTNVDQKTALEMQENLKLMPRLQDDIPGPSGYTEKTTRRRSFVLKFVSSTEIFCRIKI